MTESLKVKLLVMATALVGLPLGWYLSTSLSQRAISVQYLFHRSFAATLGALMAGSAVYLWRVKQKSFYALGVAVLGVLAILGMGFWMESGS